MKKVSGTAMNSLFLHGGGNGADGRTLQQQHRNDPVEDNVRMACSRILNNAVDTPQCIKLPCCAKTVVLWGFREVKIDLETEKGFQATADVMERRGMKVVGVAMRYIESLTEVCSFGWLLVFVTTHTPSHAPHPLSPLVIGCSCARRR